MIPSTTVPAGIPNPPGGMRTRAWAPTSDINRDDDCEPVEVATSSPPSRTRVTRWYSVRSPAAFAS